MGCFFNHLPFLNQGLNQYTPTVNFEVIIHQVEVLRRSIVGSQYMDVFWAILFVKKYGNDLGKSFLEEWTIFSISFLYALLVC